MPVGAATDCPGVEPEQDRPRRDRPSAPVPGAGTLALLALVWLSAMLTSARLTVGDPPATGHASAVRAAWELPQVISAALVAAAALALAVLNLPVGAIRALDSRTPGRWCAAAGTGLLTGTAIAVPILIGYADLPHIRSITTAIVITALLGGALAAVPHRVVVGAGVAGALAMCLVGFVAGRFGADLRGLFGAADTPGSVLTASGWVVFTVSLVAGVAAGGTAYAYLRRVRHAWPTFLAAGALPGLLAVLAEVAARLGSVRLVRTVGDASAADGTVLEYLATVRLNQALIVLFAGAVAAILALGHRGTPGSSSPASR